MNPLIQHKEPTPLFLVALVFLALVPGINAVTPPPDGGYPGQNTAKGTDALLNLTMGSNNTAIGFSALLRDTTGSGNTAVGTFALKANIIGDNNTAAGRGALYSNMGGSSNIATGYHALYLNLGGSNNVATGVDALYNNKGGDENAATGFQALYNNLYGNENTATGAYVLYANTSGVENTAFGYGALLNNTTGDGNIALGPEAGLNVSTASGVICIGSEGANVNDSCFIGRIRGVTTVNNDAIPVLIDSAGQLGTASSSRRYKMDIKPIDTSSQSIFALKPVSFRYKMHKDSTPQFGLVAEEVAAVNPDLVVRDKDGEIYTVRYDAVNAMLLNEFLKEHRRVQQLEAALTEQQQSFESKLVEEQKQIEALTAGLQKVSDQLQMSKFAPQTTLSNR